MSQQGYIGRNPGDGRTIVNRQTTHVTTGVQTSFTMTTGYEIGYLDVYLNGIKQTETLDYTASDGSTINFSLSYPPVNGDVLEFVAFETLNITNIKSARRNFSVGQDLDVSGKVTIGSSLTVASDLVVNGTFTTINTEILDVEDKTVGIASTSSPSNTTADGAGIVIYGGSDGDKSLTWNSTKSNFVLVGGGVSIGTGVTISTPAANVLAFSVNSAEKARFNNFGAFTVGYEGEAWHESTYVGVLQAGSGAWIGQTPGASARAEWVNNAYYDSVNTRWEYIAADEANRIVLENGELKLQSADAGSADGAITWNEKLKMTVGGDFKIGAPTGIGITISSSGNVDSIGIVTASSFVGNGANLTSLPAAQLSGTAAAINGSNITDLNASNIASGTVPTARLGSGTASSSTFLRGDSTFATVTSTTINNNADNRVITGSGTANTLEAESNVNISGGILIAGHTASTTVSDGEGPFIQVKSTDSRGGISLLRHSADAAGGGLYIGKSRNATIGSNTVLQNGDELGRITFSGDDGSDIHTQSAAIHAFVDGTTGSNDMPGSLRFYTNSGAGNGSSDLTERLRIDSSGRLLVGTSSARTIFKSGASGNGQTPAFQFETANDDENNSLSLTFGRNNTNSAEILFAKHRTATVGGTTVVQSSDRLGGITFSGSDGTNFQPAALILGSVDGTPGTDDMPGKLGFFTTADGAKVPTERMRVQSDGEVFIGDGLGSTNRSTLLSISGAYQEATGAWAQLGLYSSDSYAQNKGGSLVFGGQDGSVPRQYFSGIAGTKENTTSGDYAGNMKFYTRPSGSTPVERMRLHSIGALSVGTSPSATYWGTGTAAFFESTSQNTVTISHSGTNNNYPLTIRNNRVNASTGGYMLFFLGASAVEQGSIISNNGATSYNSGSDYRLKENITDISDGITRVKQLQPRRFNWISDENKTVQDGFIAHEIQSVIPEVATGTKDEIVNQEGINNGSYHQDAKVGDAVYQSVDYGKVTPLLTAALKEAIAKIETLEAKVAALEGS